MLKGYMGPGPRRPQRLRRPSVLSPTSQGQQAVDATYRPSDWKRGRLNPTAHGIAAHEIDDHNNLVMGCWEWLVGLFQREQSSQEER